MLQWDAERERGVSGRDPVVGCLISWSWVPLSQGFVVRGGGRLADVGVLSWSPFVKIYQNECWCLLFLVNSLA